MTLSQTLCSKGVPWYELTILDSASPNIPDGPPVILTTIAWVTRHDVGAGLRTAQTPEGTHGRAAATVRARSVCLVDLPTPWCTLGLGVP